MDLTGRIGRPLKWVCTTDAGFDAAVMVRFVDGSAALKATDERPRSEPHAIARIPARKHRYVPETSLLMVERTGV